MKKSRSGFTIVELLIVIVVIAILAAITIVAYNGIQQRARDSQRKQDVATIQKALEMYYMDNGKYPPGSSTGMGIDAWSTTASTSSWADLETQLSPYIQKLPTDPIATKNTSTLTNLGYNYVYFADKIGYYCSTTKGQMYLLVYKLESGEVDNTKMDACTAANPLGPYTNGNSNIRRVK